ncbi:MAG: tetratricopeptide repeat protein [Bacteroidetes bacterium]|nr:tetratricopeptide repeat protein [Bacteroidota bacterium]
MKKIFFLFAFLFSFLLPAQNSTDSILRVLKGTMPDTQRVNLLVRVAKILDDHSDTTEKKYSLEALALAKKINYERGIASSYAVLGLAEEGAGNFVAAIDDEQKAFELREKENDSLGMAKALGNMSNNEYYIGDYTSAAEHAYQSLGLYEKLGNKIGLIAIHYGIGNILVEQKSYEAGLAQFQMALELSKDFPKQPDFRGRALACIGNVYNATNKYDSAAYFYTTADSIFEKLNSTYEISVTLNNLGTIREHQGKYYEAERLFRKSLDLRRINGDSDGVCSAMQNLGNLCNDLLRYDSALFYFSHALQIAINSQSRSQRLDCYDGLAETYAYLKKYDSAYHYLNLYKELNEVVKGQASINAVNQLRTRYDQEKQKTKLDLLESKRQAEHAESARNILFLVLGIFILLTVALVVIYRNRVKEKLTHELEKQNAEISAQKKHITDSINYAKKIQDSILPPEHLVKNILPDSFILYEPKDVVSGDFYWVEKHEQYSIFSAVDCTGHGVPGALMSVVGFNLLNQAVNEMHLTKPSEILHHLDYGVNKLLRQSDKGSIVKDGMDLGLCSLDRKTNKLQFAGAFNPAYIMHKRELVEVKADKFPIGINTDGVTDLYTNHEIQLYPGDVVYLSSDGYADQFGGPLGKKFKYNRLRELLKSIYTLPAEEQKKRMRDEFLEWKGEHEQVDDILVIGVIIR